MIGRGCFLKIGKDSEVTEMKIEALAALRAWGAGEAAKEQMRLKKFETYLENLLQATGRMLKQAIVQVCTPAITPAETPMVSSRPPGAASLVTPKRPTQSPRSPGS